MYNSVINFIKNRFGFTLDKKIKTRWIVLGFGCSYVYTTGSILYIKITNKLTEDANRIEGMVHQFYTTKFIPHLSPYVLPAFLKKGCMDYINNILKSDKSEFRERMYCYSALMTISACSQAVQYIKKKYSNSLEDLGSTSNSELLPFENFIENLLNPKKLLVKTKSQSPDGSYIYKEMEEPEVLFNLKTKAFENLLKNTEVEGREMSYDQIKKLVLMTKMYKSPPTREGISKILTLLFENQKNVEKLIECEFENYNEFPMFKSDENYPKLEEVCPVLNYLYCNKFKKNSLKDVFSIEYPIVSSNADCIRMINKTLGRTFNNLPMIKVPFENRIFKKFKGEINTFLTLIEVSFIYSILKHLFDPRVPGTTRFSSLKRSFKTGFQSARGLLLFQLLLAYQEKLIQSKVYFNNEKYMLPLSFLVALSTFGSLAAMSCTQTYFFGPFILSRIML